jgi:hypothetical protein
MMPALRPPIPEPMIRTFSSPSFSAGIGLFPSC